MQRWTAAVVTGVLAAGLIGGCARFSREMYETIYHGQRQSQVRKKLGRPDRTVANAWIYVRRRPRRWAAILFEHGVVSGKIWSDTEPIDLKAIEQYRQRQSGKP